ncbi:hypothetical protein EDB85DRAFT_216739 [Lactarius pseudohatsudake]|nr:hypothetical protein EDB85DRAFT_216739 [Lactarius pseudohatsudake]
MTSSPVPHSPRPTHFDYLSSRSPSTCVWALSHYKQQRASEQRPGGGGVGNCTCIQWWFRDAQGPSLTSASVRSQTKKLHNFGYMGYLSFLSNFLRSHVALVTHLPLGAFIHAVCTPLWRIAAILRPVISGGGRGGERAQLSLSGPSRRMNRGTCHEEPHRTRCPLTHFIVQLPAVGWGVAQSKARTPRCPIDPYSQSAKQRQGGARDNQKQQRFPKRVSPIPHSSNLTDSIHV